MDANWEDMVFNQLYKVASGRRKEEAAPSLREAIQRACPADFYLYQKFNEELDRKIDAFGGERRMSKETEAMRNAARGKESMCGTNVIPPGFRGQVRELLKS